MDAYILDAIIDTYTKSREVDTATKAESLLSAELSFDILGLWGRPGSAEKKYC